MKKFVYSFIILGMFLNCKNNSEAPEDEALHEVEIAYATFGEEISKDGFIESALLYENFQKLQPGDTLDLKVKVKVKEVCQKKGCWMKVDLPEEEAMVRFKDYGFFMPKDIGGQEIIAEGKAFIEEMSVDALRHYAEDGGASPEEIAEITEPKITYSFLAHGVLVPEPENH